jgi:hypothetical protein
MRYIKSLVYMFMFMIVISMIIRAHEIEPNGWNYTALGLAGCFLFSKMIVTIIQHDEI